MGVDINGSRCLLYARKLNVDFTRTAMIGRQTLHVQRRALQESFREFGQVLDDARVEEIYTRSDGFADELLVHLGATEVHSFDVSSYEGPTHLHDMNTPVPPALKGRYSMVLDGGTLEHVFNFPVAIRNCMEMVRVGGHYVGIVPANNWMGHGFYQFSPELYCGIFTPENGFDLVSLVAFEDAPRAEWYSVRRPSEVRDRVTVVNCMPLSLLVVAKRIREADIFATTPYQSDYVSQWQRHDAEGSGANAPVPAAVTVRDRVADLLRKIIPAPVKRSIKATLRHFRSGFDRRFYRPFDPTANTWSPDDPHRESAK